MATPQSPNGHQTPGAGHPYRQPGEVPDEVEAGKGLAYLSYASMFFGLPAFLIPMIQRDNAFSLYHARHAAAIYVLFLMLVTGVSLVSFITCGIGAVLVPVVFLPFIPSVHGFVLVSRGEWTEPMLVFGLGEKFFGGIKIEDSERSGFDAGPFQGPRP